MIIKTKIQNLLKKTFLPYKRENIFNQITSLGYSISKETKIKDVSIFKCFKQNSIARNMYIVAAERDITVIVDIHPKKIVIPVIITTLKIDLKELLFSLENGRIRDKFEKGLNVDDKYSFLREFTIFGRFNHFYNNKTKSFIYKNLCNYLAGLSIKRKKLSQRKKISIANEVVYKFCEYTFLKNSISFGLLSMGLIQKTCFALFEEIEDNEREVWDSFINSRNFYEILKTNILCYKKVLKNFYINKYLREYDITEQDFKDIFKLVTKEAVIKLLKKERDVDCRFFAYVLENTDQELFFDQFDKREFSSKIKESKCDLFELRFLRMKTKPEDILFMSSYYIDTNESCFKTIKYEELMQYINENSR